jgi:outer membrane protein TolC
VSYQKRGGQFSDMVSVGVSIPIPLNKRDRQDRDTAEKAELGTKARLMYEDAQRQVDADIRNLSATLASGRERVSNLTASLLPAADQRLQLSTAAYKAGTGTLAETFAAKRGVLDARLQVLDLQRDVSLTWAQLEYQVVPPSMTLGQ